MTHEELVEKVAEGIRDDLLFFHDFSDLHPELQEKYRFQARAAIKITGEAILKNQTRNLHHISETHIKILTQGRET